MGWNMRAEAVNAHKEAIRDRRTEIAAINKRLTAANKTLTDAKRSNDPERIAAAEQRLTEERARTFADLDAISPYARFNITDMAVLYVVLSHAKEGVNRDGQPRQYSATHPGGPRTTTLGRGLYIQDIKDELNGGRGVEDALARLVAGHALVVVESGKNLGKANTYYCPPPAEIRARQGGTITGTPAQDSTKEQSEPVSLAERAAANAVRARAVIDRRTANHAGQIARLAHGLGQTEAECAIRLDRMLTHFQDAWSADHRGAQMSAADEERAVTETVDALLQRAAA
ncbi:hypothetical protein [Actinotalea sp. JY-7876]|uniref:hypothetical protein n=1 Tax=Actinotalea sp. JY-7876 TaxID=2758442 RepID=UPI0015F4FFE3|nr:hypothetical protein [Actinotalea sp. JY-7876]